MAADATIAFTGGGTGGHVYPGLAVAEALRSKGFRGRLAWIGSRKESDRAAVEASGLEYFAVPSGKLRRNLSLENAADAFRVLAGYAASLRILSSLRPALLFSKGGYVSVPPCAAASTLGIPYFTHESDLSPGLATRLNARGAERIVLSYEATRALLPAAARARAIVAGNPVRTAIRAGDAARGRAFLGAPERLPVVLFLGGSQGARQVNDLVAEILPSLSRVAFVAHQRGEAAGAAATSTAPTKAAPAAAASTAATASTAASAGRYASFTYLRGEMADVLAAADLVVGRAGAGTLWECGALGKPMVLVPLCGSGTRGDQVDNARLFASEGAAVCLAGPEASAERLMAEIEGFLKDGDRRARAGARVAALAGMDAASVVADMILERIGGQQ